jgi:hypothetical protein
MRGPRFLSLVVGDSWSCGGAHPDSDGFSLVYDLTTGAPVNWARFLPKNLVQKFGTDTAGDGTVVGTLTSSALQALYLKKPDTDPDCHDPLADPSLTFVIWPDASLPGLAIQPFSLPHAVAACADAWTIPLPMLKQLGIKPELVDALEQAHAQGLFDQPKK